MTNARKLLGTLVALAGLSATGTNGETCGASIFAETAAPAAVGGLDASRPVLARFWAAGAYATDRSLMGCAAGCTLASGAACFGGGDCIALSGINWLNATCATAGHLPLRTVFVAEQTTGATGGRWAAVNLDRNAVNAHTDIDAKGAATCGGCVSTLSPVLGGAGYPTVTSASVSGTSLSAHLAWTAPAGAAQALSNGTDLVKSYAVYSKIHDGPPATMTGELDGWVRVADLEADGAGNGGYSTDASAQVEVAIPPGLRNVTFVIGLVFDGTGNPTADPNSASGLVASDQSLAVEVNAGGSLLADGFETGTVGAWSATIP